MVEYYYNSRILINIELLPNGYTISYGTNADKKYIDNNNNFTTDIKKVKSFNSIKECRKYMDGIKKQIEFIVLFISSRKYLYQRIVMYKFFKEATKSDFIKEIMNDLLLVNPDLKNINIDNLFNTIYN